MILLERYLRLFLYGTALDNVFCLALDISNKRLSWKTSPNDAFSFFSNLLQLFFNYVFYVLAEWHEGRQHIVKGACRMGNKKVKRKLGANIWWILILAILIIFVAYLVMGYVAKI